ncbi:MAG TPA: hypothetical protein VGM28_07295 [Candidatus Limnocylindrales bacterium]
MTAGPAPTSPLPPDPVQYDAVRNEHARKRGMPGPYIAGGDDPELEKTLRSERRYVRLLIAMVIAIIVLGFVLGVVEVLLGIGTTDLPAI